MAIKAIDDLARLDIIILTFLVFRVYLYITKMDVLLLFITKRAEVIYIATKKVYYLQVKC